MVWGFQCMAGWNALRRGRGRTDQRSRTRKWPVDLLVPPEMVPDRTDGTLPNAKELVKPGYFRAEKLVNLAKHNYSLEPNVTFTPDMKWIVFRSNMFGPTHVFAVEVKKG